MKKTLLPLILLLIAVSCSKPGAVVNLTLKEGISTNVELYKLDYNKLTFTDSLSTNKNGRLHCFLPLADAVNPTFYYLYHNGTKLAGIVASDKDRISVEADTLGNCTIDGSEDSRLLQEMDNRMAESIAKIESILDEAPDDENLQLSRIYIEHKRATLRQIMENPFSITSAAALFQKFNDQLYVFQEPTDVYIFTAIRDSLIQKYPNNDFVAAVTKAIDARHNADQLNELLSGATYGMPDIKMTDMDGGEHALSELFGKVILLSFWSTAQDEHKVFNQEMVPIYEKYHDRGFEIYQVCVDEKPVWAAAVRNQNLPWICVNDGLGISSPAVAAYNLNSIPTMFIISRDCNILGKDIYDPAEIEKIIASNL
ncbi:MAG: TlpA family protein disulfide reductase [Bacteroidales bacterium]|nr:TlpA family protein disulfide reductase [Bacteroidales bacterium]